MDKQEQAIYWQAYFAALQGIHAHGKYYQRAYNAAEYHPSTSYPASENPNQVGVIASKQAHNAVEHYRALKESFTEQPRA